MAFKDKIADWNSAASTIETWKAEGLSVVFTNGCFDIIHAGHALFLEEAAALGDRLILGLNDDASVTRLKGPHRPIQQEEARSFLLAALASVDMVVLFPQDTPLELITWLKPDILVKGGDYTPDQIVGAEIVTRYGGSVKSLSFHQGFSTSRIESHILQMHNQSKKEK